MRNRKMPKKARHHIPNFEDDQDYEAKMIAINKEIEAMNEPNEIDRQDDDLMGRYFRQYLR